MNHDNKANTTKNREEGHDKEHIKRKVRDKRRCETRKSVDLS